ncbi:MAG: hypothetical protein HZB55_10680 [Deltaproteobacteria bacterium]|nr:hypothetical protein [Deltaproteobacteria bacterium]
MATDLEQALWALEEALEGVVSFVRASSYGLRLAAKRLGDLESASAGPPPAAAEMARLAEAVEQAEDHLSDVTVLALGDHFRAFLARALELPTLPPLPSAVADLEALPGTPGALAKVSLWVPLLLQLYRVALRGGRLDRRALEALGISQLELPFPGGKVKMFRQGDHVALSERQLEEAAHALLDAARAIRLRLETA